MSSLLRAYDARADGQTFLASYWPILFGLAILYLPTYWDLWHSIWQSEEQGHGPIILLVVLYLVLRQRHHLAALPARPRMIAGSALLALGLVLYAIGRSQAILIFEIGSQIPVASGALLIAIGSTALRALWFPLVFLVFMVPLPGFVVDALTGSLKQYVSTIVEQVLYGAGYPIARSGVVLVIGQYQLLVADACSGLHSLYSLSALGALYLYLMGHPGWLRNGLLLAAILPIAFAANIVRTITLVLITYHFGDAAGQGFLHGTAGMVLFVAALLLLFATDKLLGLLLRGAKISRSEVASTVGRVHASSNHPHQ
jgi:exosortase B